MELSNKFLLILLVIFCASCKRNWSYEGSAGPANWGDLDEKFKFCKIGYDQSPIDVKYDFTVDEELKFFYGKSSISKEKKNYVMQINIDEQMFLTRGKKKYFARHLVFHHPSEHLVNGKARSLEMQIIHKSDDEQFLQLAVFLEVGKENKQFAKLINFLNSKDQEGQIILSKLINPEDEVFFYNGSLTVPPCSEGVKWYVMETPIEISKEQMNQIIKSAIFAKTNARPVKEFHPEKF